MNLEARAPHLWTYLPLDRHEVRSVVAAMCALLAVKTGAAAYARIMSFRCTAAGPAV